MMVISRLENLVDWILKRKRCPFCVIPFPVLKCVGYDSWRCPQCETDFSLDNEGDLEPIFTFNNQNSKRTNIHFPTSFHSSFNILCDDCTEKQEKIVQVLNAFDSFVEPSSQIDHLLQYSLYSKKLENRYPLCATCSYRVSVHLKKCEDEATMQERRGINVVGGSGDWQNKINLAQKMKFKQFKRKIVKFLFFWPDFIFQLILTSQCIFKSQIYLSSENYSAIKCVLNVPLFYIIEDSEFNNNKTLKLWIPNFKSFFPSIPSFVSFFFIFCLVLFLIQLNGIVTNRRSFTTVILQAFLLTSRSLIGNFLFRPVEEQPIELNVALLLTAIGLAIIFRTKSRNSQIKLEKFKFYEKPRLLNENFNNFTPVTENEINNSVLLRKSDRITSTAKNNNYSGFEAYSGNHHRFHSFANAQESKSIMPWPEKPLPGLLNEAGILTSFKSSLNFNENINLSDINGTRNISKIRPTKLDVEDPLELEPMFSSFSLSDEPKQLTLNRSSRAGIISSKAKNNIHFGVNTNKNIISCTKELNYINNFLKTNLMNSSFILNLLYNFLITSILLFFRISLRNQSNSNFIIAILVITFGLRGFVWPRLSFNYQILGLLVALGRVMWLVTELIEWTEPQKTFKNLILSLDVILILLR